MKELNKNEQHKKEESVLQKAFLSALSLTGNITKSAELVEMSRTNHYMWLQDENYKKKYDIAMEEAADRLEFEARRRAVDGVLEPVFYKGEECGAVKKYSDTLLMFLMKGANPEKYADRIKQESHNTNENVNKNIDLKCLTTEEIKELLNNEDKATT